MSVEIEKKRQEIQIVLDANKTLKERNVLGQYATSYKLAEDILSYAQTLFSRDEDIRFLDPALGTGAFYSALLKMFPNDKIVSARGYEKDQGVAGQAFELWKKTLLEIYPKDFTQAPIPKSANRKANLIICNPPYVRHHHLHTADKSRLQDLSNKTANINFNGLTGFYCYFMAISHGWMAEDGIAGWLVPSEFMDVNYGRELKKYLLEKVTLLRVHRYDPKDLQFDDALVSSSVIWFKNSPPSPDHKIEFTYGGTLKKPLLAKKVKHIAINAAEKWNNLFFAKSVNKPSVKTIKLSEIFTVKRGLATGANDFFILKPEQISAYNLPKEFFVPILPSPKSLKFNEIEADEAGLPLLNQNLYLLNCYLPEQTIKDQYPSLWNYLQKGVELGISNRYLCKSRKVWYFQERRPASPLLCTYMGRGNKNNKPFRFILNHSKATAPNVFLMIYPNSNWDEKFVSNPALLKSVWQQLNELSSKEISDEGRIYGGGLHKIEPKELGNVRIDISDDNSKFCR